MILFTLFRLLKGVEDLTGLKGDDLFHQKGKPAPKADPIVAKPEAPNPSAPTPGE
jgi:hypothetical protein